MISVVIPTMWKPAIFPQLLESLLENDLIDDIVIVSNANPSFTISNDKIKIIQQEENIGVNPAWNIGVRLAKNQTIVILNDDFLVDSSFFEEALKIKSKHGMVSINFDPSEDHIVEITKRSNGLGCCFMMEKSDYVEVPLDLKIFYGDDWLFTNCLLKGKSIALIPNISNNGILSETSKQFNCIGLLERDRYINHLSRIIPKKAH